MGVDISPTGTGRLDRCVFRDFPGKTGTNSYGKPTFTFFELISKNFSTTHAYTVFEKHCRTLANGTGGSLFAITKQPRNS